MRVHRAVGDELAVCRYCDTVHRRSRSVGHGTARCRTCDAPLYHTNDDLSAMLAATITAAVAFVVANAFPLITLTSQGHQTRATLWGAIVASYDQNLPLVAVTLAATLIVAPVLEIGLLLWVLVPLHAGTRPPGFIRIMRSMHALRPWRMVEVFLLGVLVAIVKLAGLATTIPGWGAFGIAVMTMALASLASFDQGALWRRAAEVRR
jgi:paraquat-inducible protein A